MKGQRAIYLFLTFVVLLSLCNCSNVNNGDSIQSLYGSNRGRTMSERSDAEPKSDSAQIDENVSVSLTSNVQHLSLHEPIILDFTVKNDSSQPVIFNLGQDRKEAFLITVTEPNGNQVQLPPLKREGFSIAGRVALEPRQTYTQHLLLDEWYKPGAPGAYEILARLVNPIQNREGETVQETPEFHISLEIGARDPTKLKQKAESLANLASSNASYEKAAFAALALGYMDDPIAVPYLERVMATNSMVTPVVIRGLERIGGREAVQVLLNALSIQRGETAQLIRGTLSNIERKSTDPEVKRRIKSVL